MLHTESLIATQRIVCVKRYFDDSVRPWKIFLSHYLKNVGSEFLLKWNFKLSSPLCKLPIFYKECLEAWSDFKSCTPYKTGHSKWDYLEQPKPLLINKQSIFNKKIKEACFVHLGDILSNDGKLKNWDVFEEKISPCRIISSYSEFLMLSRLSGNSVSKMETM